jgi:uncharacterized membrane protein
MAFEQFVVPDPAITAGLLVATLVVAVLLYAVRPQVSQRTVLAFVPWMVTGALLHVLYQMHTTVAETLVPAVPPVVLSAPSVYVTTFVFAGVIWGVSTVTNPGQTDRVAALLAVGGAIGLAAVGGYTVWVALDRFALDPVLPLLGLLGSLALTAVVYLAVGLWRPDIVAKARNVGALLLFAHVFDAITTAIGVELLDTGERSTVPRLIMDIAADLPTADLLGEAWLFVVVKLVVATTVVVVFYDYVHQRPTEGNLFFAFIAAVGLGPAAHNFFLFALGV